MNNKNKILVGFLSLLLALSVGYALFSETITINGTATAKGSFDITSTCYPGDYYNMFHQEFNNYVEGGYVDKKCSISGSEVSISTELQYPSALRVYTVEMKNTGSMDALLKFYKHSDPDYYPEAIKNVSIDLKLYNKSDDSLYKTYSYESMESVGDTDEAIHYGITIPAAGLIVIKKEDGTFLDKDAKFIANNRLYKDSDGNNYLKITPNESIVMFFMSYWGNNAEQTNYYGVTDTKYKVDFVQFTDNFTLDPDAELCIGGC